MSYEEVVQFQGHRVRLDRDEPWQEQVYREIDENNRSTELLVRTLGMLREKITSMINAIERDEMPQSSLATSDASDMLATHQERVNLLLGLLKHTGKIE